MNKSSLVGLSIFIIWLLIFIISQLIPTEKEKYTKIKTSIETRLSHIEKFLWTPSKEINSDFTKYFEWEEASEVDIITKYKKKIQNLEDLCKSENNDMYITWHNRKEDGFTTDYKRISYIKDWYCHTQVFGAYNWEFYEYKDETKSVLIWWTDWRYTKEFLGLANILTRDILRSVWTELKEYSYNWKWRYLEIQDELNKKTN
jgi:hypothetical protein